MALAIIFLSYTLVTGEGGLISLCQITLAGIGAFAAARLAAEAGLAGRGWRSSSARCSRCRSGSWWRCPSLRIGDLYLALLTLGFALLIEQFVWIAHRVRQLRRRPARSTDPFGLGITDRMEMYAIVAVVFAVVALLIVNLKRATSGLVFASIRSSEPASLTTGISIVRAKLVLFGDQRVRRRPRRRAVRHRRRQRAPHGRSTRSSASCGSRSS